MKQTLIDILIVLAVPALIVIGYFAVRSGSIQDAWLSITGNTGSSQEVGARTTQALQELENIKLDSTIFTWKEFKDMKFSQSQVKIEPVGRKNPFFD
jgi:hypothetical protein